MFRFLFRTIGLLLLGVAVVAATVDGARSIAASTMVVTPLGQSWYEVDVDSLNLSQAVVQRYVLPEVWDSVIFPILRLPTVLVGAVLGSLFMLVGLPKRRRDPLDSTVL